MALFERSRLLLGALIFALVGCGPALIGEGAEDDLLDEEGEREVSAARTCVVASSMLTVRTCSATTDPVTKARSVGCAPVGTVFGGQSIPSVLSLSSITSPVDADESLLGARLEALGLVDVVKSLPADLADFNAAISAARTQLGQSAGGACSSSAWMLGAVNNLVPAPRGLGFLCARKTDGTTLLECDSPGSVPLGNSATSSPSSTVKNGVSITFAKTGCGSFRYTLTNLYSSSKASYTSAVSGVPLQPPCSGTLGEAGKPYASQTCSVTGVKGGGVRSLTYSGTVTRGASSLPFSFAITLRCDA